MNRALVLAVLFLHSAAAVPAGPAPDAGIPSELRTVAETSGFRSTSSYLETMNALESLAALSPVIRVSSFGSSAQGRDLPLVIVSSDRAFTPEAAREVDKPVVLLQSGIHAGEIDGKDATLLLLRDIALGRRPDLAEATTLLLVPILNVDGHERVSPSNRPQQAGPEEGMGFRTTADGLDLNRDHVKLDSRELRALVGLLDLWKPDLHVDIHVTNGSDHAWVLTWSTAEAPQLSPEVDAWLDVHLEAALTATGAAGFPSGPYVSLLDRRTPAAGFSSIASHARFSTGYLALRNRPSILVEMHAHVPFERRVRACRSFVENLLLETSRGGDALRGAVRAADRRVAGLGAPDADPSEAVVRWRDEAATDTIRFPVREWSLEPSVITGGEMLTFVPGTLREITVPWVHRLVPELTVPRPRGYLVLPGWPQVEELVAAHGLEARRVDVEVPVVAEEVRLGRPRPADAPYQGRIRIETDATRKRIERKAPPGSVWVPADQPLFEIAVQLFEPEAPDSMVSWGMLNTVFERKEYISGAVLEELASRMLRDDPTIRAAWEKVLEDPGFADDVTQRYLWWYRRTPFWDDTIGLLPILRVMEAPVFGEGDLTVFVPIEDP